MDGLILDLAEVTPEWLTERLRIGGYLDQAVVVGVRVTPTGDLVARLDVEYSGNQSALPTRLFLKKGGGNSCVDREVRFWQETASVGVVSPTAPCLDAVCDPETSDAHLLSEDVTDTHYHRDELDLSGLRGDSERVTDRLSQIHAVWWDHPRLGRELGHFPKEDNVLFFDTPSGFVKRLAYAIDLVGDRFTTDRRRIYERVLGSYPFRDLRGVSRLSPGNHLTAINGDLGYSNVFFPNSPGRDPVYIIDWGLWEVRVGTDDLAQLGLCGHCESETNLTRDLVRRYHDGQLRNGVKDYLWEDCWHDYRLSTIRALVKAITPFRDDERCWVMLHRAFDSYQDLECEELLTA